MKLWGGNYGSDPDAAFWEFNRSFAFDRRLLEQEIRASRAFARALGRCGAIPKEQADQLDQGLAEVTRRVASDPALLEADVEDVHSFVETRLAECIGAVAGQGHVGRSRNEQTVTALRLWVREAIDALLKSIHSIVSVLAKSGDAGAEAVMPGFTHTRAAEPITFGHWAAAHAWGFVRDHGRLADARRRVNVLPLGSGALAGTAIPLDRDALAKELGFEAVSENALDAVMDRDFAVEFVAACAQLQTRLSRIAEDLIWLSTPEFGFFGIPEAFTTGSSLMPQKKNPDALELIRGKTGRVDGALVRLLTVTKGLPSGYQKDLQEDKEAVFDAAETVTASLAIATGVLGGLTLDRDAMRHAASNEEMIATALAVELAREGMPFRQAHERVGALVAEARRQGKTLREIAATALRSESPKVAARIDVLFDVDAAVRAKSLRGGTAPDAVRASLRAARAALESR